MAYHDGPMHPDQGPFDNVPMGAPFQGPILVNEYHQNDHGQQHRGGFLDPWDDADSEGKPKKNKNKNSQNKSSVEVRYEGYILEKLDPRPGEKGTTWARVGKRAMPFGEKKLQDIVKLHRQKTRQGPLRDFEQLTSNQQGTVNRLIAERKLHESNKKADWVLEDVQRSGKWTWTSMEVKKIQVILKRQDKFYAKDKDKDKDNTARRESKSYQNYEIIDLDDPLERKNNRYSRQMWGNDDFEGFDDRGAGGGNKKKKNKKNGQNRNDDDFFAFDDRGGGGGGGGGHDFHHPPPPPMNHNFQHPHQQPMPMQMPIHDQFNGPMHGPPGHPPLFEPHGQPPPPPAPQPPLARHPSARQPPLFNNPNPFQPDPQFAVHDHHDFPPMDSEDFAYDPHGDRERRRSKSLRRQSSTRRQSVDARKFNELEDKVHELTSRIRDWQGSSGSSNESYEGDSASSRHPDDRNYNDTPATSYFSRGSLERRQSYDRPRYRSRRYTDADIDIEPGYTYRKDRGYRPEPRRHRSSRPRVHHTQSYDDYPFGRAAKPRYLPAPPPRLTDFDEHYDYEDDNNNNNRDSRPSYRRSVTGYESYHDGYDGGRRDLGGRGDRRRHRSVGRSHWD